MADSQQDERPSRPQTPCRLMERREIEEESHGGPSHVKRKLSIEDGGPLRKKRKTTLDDLSFPPTMAELNNYQDVEPSALPKAYRRDLEKRVFVNRNLRLDRIRFFGFDMDYTLAVYNSPEYEAMTYGLIVERLIVLGYPPSIRSLQFNPEFAVRGLFLDTKLGNMLKVDTYGNILMATHGHKRLDKEDLLRNYPNLFVKTELIGKRYYLHDTLFALPEAALYPDLVNFFETTDRVAVGSDMELSYANLHTDVRAAVDWVHMSGKLQEKTLAELPKYVHKDPQLPCLLRSLRNVGVVFLLTNSEYAYTNHLMNYLLGDDLDETHPSWRDFFDIVIVGARKPKFFAEGTALREVEPATGNLHVRLIQHFEKNKVYQGGSQELFSQLTGAKGNDVLYLGDHIFGDIIKSKKEGWRTYLVVPELRHEFDHWRENHDKYVHLSNLEFMMAEAFRGMDAKDTSPPDISDLRAHIKETVATLTQANNKYFGSPFGSGSKKTFFAFQVQRYADIYAGSVVNLLSYPLFYHFTAHHEPLPHEREAMRENQLVDVDDE